jgi:hypothetical protein
VPDGVLPSYSRGRWSEPARAVELPPEVAGELIHDALTGFHHPRPLRTLLGPTVRPPAAILHRYRLRVDERLVDYIAEARRHALFELVPRDQPPAGMLEAPTAAIASANTGMARLTIASVAVSDSRNQPGISNASPASA